MSYINVTDTRKVVLNTDEGVRIILTRDSPESKMLKFQLGTQPTFDIQGKDLLDALVAMYPDNVAYKFREEG